MRGSEADDSAVGFGHDRGSVGGIVEEFGRFSLELGVEFFGEGFADLRVGCICAPLGAFFYRFSPKAFEKLRIDLFYFLDHVFDYGARFAGRVAGSAHAPETVEDDAGDGVDHRGESGDGENVARDFDGTFFCCALDFLDVLGAGIRANVPNVGENGASVADKKSGKLTVVIPGFDYGLFVDFFARFAEVEIDGGNVGLDMIHSDVALTLLFGIVEGMGVEKGPDELAANVFEAELEGGVLKDGVMAAVKGSDADVEALLVGDFFGSNEMVGVAGAGGGYSRVKWVGEGISESDARSGGLQLRVGRDAVEHAGLSGHVGESFYMDAELGEGEIRRLTVDS